MTGECQKCGEHALECKCETFSRPQENDLNPTDKFFYKGKFFQNEKDFWKYSQDWPFMNTDEETFFREWNDLGKEIWMNIQIRESKLLNGALNEILEENFIHLLQKFL